MPPLPSSGLMSHWRGSLVRVLKMFTPFFTLALRGRREQERAKRLLPRPFQMRPASAKLRALLSFSFFCFFHIRWHSQTRGLRGGGRRGIGDWSERGIHPQTQESRDLLFRTEGEGKRPQAVPKLRSSSAEGSGEKPACPGQSFSVRGDCVLRGHVVTSGDILGCLNRGESAGTRCTEQPSLPQHRLPQPKGPQMPRFRNPGGGAHTAFSTL